MTKQALADPRGGVRGARPLYFEATYIIPYVLVSILGATSPSDRARPLYLDRLDPPLTGESLVTGKSTYTVMFTGQMQGSAV